MKKIKWKEIRQNINRDCQHQSLGTKSMSGGFFCSSFFISFCTWHIFPVNMNCFYTHKKTFEQERIQYILYSKRDLRHRETGKAEIRKQAAPARQQMTKYLRGEDGTGSLPGSGRAPCISWIVLFSSLQRKYAWLSVCSYENNF